MEQIAKLRKVSPKLRREHLQNCLDTALGKNDEEGVEAIKRVLRRKAVRRRW